MTYPFHRGANPYNFDRAELSAWIDALCALRVFGVGEGDK